MATFPDDELITAKDLTYLTKNAGSLLKNATSATVNGAPLGQVLTAHAGAAKRASGSKPTSHDKRKLKLTAKALLALKSLQSFDAEDSEVPVDETLMQIIPLHAMAPPTASKIRSGSEKAKSRLHPSFTIEHELPTPPLMETWRQLGKEWQETWHGFWDWTKWLSFILAKVIIYWFPGFVIVGSAATVLALFYSAFSNPILLVDYVVAVFLMIPQFMANLLIASSNEVNNGMHHHLLSLGTKLWYAVTPLSIPSSGNGSSFSNDSSLENGRPSPSSFDRTNFQHNVVTHPYPPSDAWTVPSTVFCLYVAWRSYNNP